MNEAFMNIALLVLILVIGAVVAGCIVIALMAMWAAGND